MIVELGSWYGYCIKETKIRSKMYKKLSETVEFNRAILLLATAVSSKIRFLERHRRGLILVYFTNFGELSITTRRTLNIIG